MALGLSPSIGRRATARCDGFSGGQQNWQAVDSSFQCDVASADANYAGWAGTEMLFHESSHALFLNAMRTINAALTDAGKRSDDLWHVVLFYIAGEVTRQQLAAERMATG